MSVIPYPKINGTVSQITNVSNTSVFRSPFTGAVKTQGRGGAHLRMLITHNNRDEAQRRKLDGYVSALRGQANRTMLRDHSYSGPSGSLVVGELLTDPNMLNVSSWQSGANSDLRLVSNGLRFIQTAATVDTVRQNPEPITVVNGLRYALVVEFAGGYLPTGSHAQSVRLGTTSGGTQVASASGVASEVYGRVVAGDVVSGTSIYPSWTPASADVGQYIDVSTASLSRCLQVDGATQFLNQLNVIGLDVDSPGQLLAGDQFEINWQLKILSQDVDGDSGGRGKLVFDPPMRSLPADDTPIILHRPHGQFLLASNETSRTNRIGGVADYALEFIEDIAV